MQGTVTRTRAGAVTVHTYTAPEHGWRTNSHLIELPTQLIAFDAQLTFDYAAEVVAVAERIGKPVTRLYISHAYQGHLVGAAAFTAETYALASQCETIDHGSDVPTERDDRPTPEDIDASPTHARVIDHTVQPGTEIIDGVTFEFLAPVDAETTDQLAIGLPDQRILLAQDVIYHDIHLFVGNDISDALEKLAGCTYDIVLTGQVGTAESD